MLKQPVRLISRWSPLRLGNLQEGRRLHDAGVADRDVERVDGRQRRVDRRPVADVGLDVGDLAVHPGPRQPRLGLIGRFTIDQRDGGAEPAQLRAHRRADIARAAGDGDSPSVQTLHAFLPCACFHMSLESSRIHRA